MQHDGSVHDDAIRRTLAPRTSHLAPRVPVLEVRGLSKRFGSLEVTRNVSFRLEEGARCALIGPNGAGKTTLINLIGGRVTAERG